MAHWRKRIDVLMGTRRTSGGADGSASVHNPTCMYSRRCHLAGKDDPLALDLMITALLLSRSSHTITVIKVG